MEAATGESSQAGWHRPDAPLGTLVHRAALLSEEQLEKALAESVRSGRRLGQVLLQWGWVEEEDLARLLAGQRGLAFVRLAEAGVDRDVARLLPDETARLYRALPMGVADDGTVVVALEDPKDDVAMEAVQAVLARAVRFVVATRTELFAALDDVHGKREAEVAPPSAAPPARAARIALRLANGEKLEVGEFPDERSARAGAEELIARLAAANGSGWPYVAGRYVNPGAIVSVDLS